MYMTVYSTDVTITIEEGLLFTNVCMYLHTIVTQGGGTGEVWQKGADPGPPQEEGI